MERAGAALLSVPLHAIWLPLGVLKRAELLSPLPSRPQALKNMSRPGKARMHESLFASQSKAAMPASGLFL